MLDRYPDPRQQAARAARARRRRPGEEDVPLKPPSRAGRYLAAATVILILLIMFSRSRNPGPTEAEQVAAVDTAPPPASAPARPPARRPVPPPPAIEAPAGTPTLDLLARLEGHRRVTRAGSAVYLDSLLADSDSVLRRWPGGAGAPVTVAFIDDETAQQVSFGLTVVREAFRAWEALRLGLSFDIVQDASTADVVVRWIPRFDAEEQRAGHTAIEFDHTGIIRRGNIQLAVTAQDGCRIDRATAMMVAMHEVGHALGLAHSADPRDVMYATPRTSTLSERDRRTVELIYGLPAGSVKGGDQ